MSIHQWKNVEIKRRKLAEEETTAVDEDRVYFDFTIGGSEVGRVVIHLHSREAPNCCLNFKKLCTGEEGVSRKNGCNLSYLNTPIHRVEKNFIIQGGDIVKGNGSSGECALQYNPRGRARPGCFDDENSLIKHDKPGRVSMANRGPDTNNSQFFITVSPCPHLDGKNTCFGTVESGLEVILAMTRLEVSEGSKPTTPISIKSCGQLPLTNQSDVEGKSKEKMDLLAAAKDQLLEGVRDSVQAALKQVVPQQDDTTTGRKSKLKKKKKSKFEISLDDSESSDD